MTRKTTDHDDEDELVFLPLGGAGEIGMNLNLYGLGPSDDPDWLMIDFGVTFGNGTVPGVDLIFPDPTFIVERRDRLAGLVLTHAHEDHLGAIPYLWERLRCPVWATPFTVSVLRRKLREHKLENRVPIHPVPLGGRFRVGPFDLEMISLTHSIPEPNAVAIRTPLGTVLHTGDWKLDPGPVIGGTADEAGLAALGEEGVHAIVCDSTGALEPGHSGSEADLLDSLTRLIAKQPNRVAVTCFATNVARMETVARAAAANDRTVIASGRAIRRIESAARENGYLNGIASFGIEEDAGHLPKENTLILCTGSQGEPRAALARIATGDHPRIVLDRDDTVIFSSRVIPGNELAVARVQNGLIRRGVKLVTWRDHLVHVSGHPARDEMARMYELVKPRVCVPVHGETRHLHAHAALARAHGVAEPVVAENGQMVCLAPGPAEIVDHVPSGRLVLEGNRVMALDGHVVRGRSRALWNGSAVVTVVIDDRGQMVADPQLSTVGLLDAEDEEIEDRILDAVERAVDKAPNQDDAMEEAIRIAARRAFRDVLDKKPVMQVHLVRV